jgi:hypothetical protein
MTKLNWTIRILGFFCLCLLATLANAQGRRSYFTVGPAIGFSNYLGDLDDDLFFFKFTKPAIGVNVQYYFDPHLHVRLGAYQAWVGAMDAASSNVGRQARNLHFRSPLTEVSVHLVYDFIGNFRRYKYRPFWTPYLFAGLGVYAYNPKAKYYDQAQNESVWVELQPLGTEGQFLPLLDQGYPRPYALTQINIPFGVGIRYKFTYLMDIGFEVGLRKLFTDYLDDVSSVYPNLRAMQQQNPKSYILSDRSYDLLNDQGLPTYRYGAGSGNIRGFSNQDDWYIFSMLTIDYIIDARKCPRFGPKKFGRRR